MAEEASDRTGGGEDVTELLDSLDTFVRDLRRAYTEASASEQQQRGSLTLETIVPQVFAAYTERTRSVPMSSGTPPFALRQLPTLAAVAVLQSRLTTTVMCALATRPVVTLYDLEEEICLQESVTRFAELGFGHGLQCLPIVQRYFQVKANTTVFPVTVTQVIEFFLYDQAAQHVLNDGGDVRDAMNAFAAYYQRHYLRDASSSPTTSTPNHGGANNDRKSECEARSFPMLSSPSSSLCSSPPLSHSPQVALRLGNRITNPRQLGVHLQDFPSFTAMLRRAQANVNRAVNDAVESVEVRLQENKPVYTAVIAGLDAALVQVKRQREADQRERRLHRLRGPPLPSHGLPPPPSSSASISFHTTSFAESAAKQTAVPLTLWENCETTAGAPDGAERRLTDGLGSACGGVCLRVTLGRVTMTGAVQNTNGVETVDHASRLSVASATSTPCGSEAERNDTKAVAPASALARLRALRKAVHTTPVAAITTEDDFAAAAGEESIEAKSSSVPPPPPPPSSSSSFLGGGTSELQPPAHELARAAQPVSAGPPRRRRGGVIREDVTVAVALPHSGDHHVASQEHSMASTPTEAVGAEKAVADSSRSPLSGITEGGAVSLSEDLLRRFVPATVMASSETVPLESSATQSSRYVKPSAAELDAKSLGMTPPTNSAQPVVPRRSVMEELDGYLRDEENSVLNPDDVIHTLSRITVGMVIDFHVVARVLRRLVVHMIMTTTTKMMRTQSPALPPPYASTAFLPIPHPRHCAEITTTKAASDTVHETAQCTTYWEVVDVASPQETCWDGVNHNDHLFLHHVNTLFSLGLCGDNEELPPQQQQQQQRNSSTKVPDTWKAKVIAALGVKRSPTLRAWLASCRVTRRLHAAPHEITADLLLRHLNVLETCVKCDYDERVKQMEREEKVEIERVGEVALMELLGSVNQWVLRESYLFPFRRAWCRGGDGFFLAGPRFFGYLEVHMKPLDARAPPLRLVPFKDDEPHFAVSAVLQRCGVRSLDAALTKVVTFRSPPQLLESAKLHEKVAAVTPYVQGYLEQRHPVYYHMVYDLLARRLRRIRVLLGSHAETKQWMRYDGYVYGMTRSARLLYIAEHNTLYGEAEAFTPAVVAEAASDLFLPVSPSVSVRAELRRVLEALFAALSSVTAVEEDDAADDAFARRSTAMAGGGGGGNGCDRSAMSARFEEALQGEARYLNFTRHQGSTAGTKPEGHKRSTAAHSHAFTFTVSAAPLGKFQPHFPPGTDALSLVRGAPHASTPASARGGSESVPPNGSVSDATLRAMWYGSARALLRRQLQQESLPGVDVDGAETAAGYVFSTRSLPQWESPFFSEAYGSVLSLVANAAEEEQGEEDRAGLSATATTRKRISATAENEKPKLKRGRDSGDSEVTRGPENAEDDDDEEDGVLSFHGLRSSNARKRIHFDHGGADPSVRALLTVGAGPANDTVGYATAAERFVFQQLQAQYRDEPSVRVVWANANGEAGTPFDIVVVRMCSREGAETARSRSTQQQQQQPHVLFYVEVKSTASRDRKEFIMSVRELLFAARFGSAYKVYRVFGASCDPLRQMKTQVLSDVVKMWHSGQLTVSGEVRVRPST